MFQINVGRTPWSAQVPLDRLFATGVAKILTPYADADVTSRSDVTSNLPDAVRPQSIERVFPTQDHRERVTAAIEERIHQPRILSGVYGDHRDIRAARQRPI
jgi:hypothetical protein